MIGKLRFQYLLVLFIMVFILDTKNSFCFPTEICWVIDQVGRSVIVSRNPERVISLSPNITEIIYAIGREDRLVGVTKYSNYPSPSQTLPKVGSYVKLDIEKIVALKPDLCIATKDGTPKDTVDRLTSMGIPVFAINPVNIASIITAIEEIDMVLNGDKNIGTLIADMNKRISQIDMLIEKTESRPKVFFQIGASPIVAAGTDTFINELIVRSGGINLSRGRAMYPRFSREQILLMDPDIIIITSMVKNDESETLKQDWESWPQISAVKHGRIHVVDPDIMNRPTPRVVDALEIMSMLIHPELFKL